MANRNLDAEHGELLRKDSIHVLGTQVERNDKDWYYALVFPIKVAGENDQIFDAVVPDPVSKWKEIFPSEQKATPFSGLKSTDCTWEAFTQEVRQNVIKYIRDLGCEVMEFRSVDEDEIFVLMGMKDEKTRKQFAFDEEAVVRIRPESYEAHDYQCPTDTKVGKVFHKERLAHLTLKGTDHFNDFPAFVRYTPEIDEIVEEVPETEMLRLLRHSLRKTCRLQLMEQEGILRLFFPLHKWTELEEMYSRGWNNPYIPFYFPKAHMPDSVAEYFGAHVASYFHFYNTFSRWLLVPGVLSVIFPFVRIQLSHHQAHWLDTGFGALMCVWTTMFLVANKHSMSLKLLKWGMGPNRNCATSVRKSFNDEIRGTWPESIRTAIHWVIVVCFVCETIVVSRKITEHRLEVLDDPDGTKWGMSNKDLAKYFKYMITANIKIVEVIFTPLSIYLSTHENHRTQMDLKNNMIVKLFAVKFVLFYYPFIRTIFIQPLPGFGEGCSGGGYEGCLDSLRSDLQIFFVTQVLSAVGGLVAQVLMMYYTIRKEVQRKKSSESMLTYVEVQAMLSDYDEEAEVSDYMQAVLNFGFLSMFSAVAPSMCFLCFLSNLPMKRLLAYRFSYSQKRVIPIVTVGIGHWQLILNFLEYLGVTCTTYIVVFAFNIFELESFSQQLLVFILIERVLAAVKMTIDLGSGDKSLSHLRIEEYNDDVREIILTQEMRKVTLRQGSTFAGIPTGLPA